MASRMKKGMQLLNIDEALKLVNDFYGREVYKKRTIYNKIHKGELKRYGPCHHVLLDKAEIEKKMCF